jgi:hypothetical protein
LKGSGQIVRVGQSLRIKFLNPHITSVLAAA